MNQENDFCELEAIPASPVQDFLAVLEARKNHRANRPVIKVLDFLAIKLAKELDIPDELAEKLATVEKVKVLYDGPDGIEITATPFRRQFYVWFRDNPDATSVIVSPSMLLDIRHQRCNPLEADQKTAANPASFA